MARHRPCKQKEGGRSSEEVRRTLEVALELLLIVIGAGRVDDRMKGEGGLESITFGVRAVLAGGEVVD